MAVTTLTPTSSVRPLGEEHLRMFKRTVGSVSDDAPNVAPPGRVVRYRSVEIIYPERDLPKRKPDNRSACMRILRENGLRQLTYLEALDYLVNVKYRSGLQGHQFWVSGRCAGKHGKTYIVSKVGRLMRPKTFSLQEENREVQIGYPRMGTGPLLLGVYSDSGGPRYYLYAGSRADVVVGAKT